MPVIFEQNANNVNRGGVNKAIISIGNRKCGKMKGEKEREEKTEGRANKNIDNKIDKKGEKINKNNVSHRLIIVC